LIDQRRKVQQGSLKEKVRKNNQLQNHNQKRNKDDLHLQKRNPPKSNKNHRPKANNLIKKAVKSQFYLKNQKRLKLTTLLNQAKRRSLEQEL